MEKDAVMTQDNPRGAVSPTGASASSSPPSSPLGIIARLINPPPLVTVLRLSGIVGRIGPSRAGIGIDGLDPFIKKAFRPRRLAAVALAVNSPGGSAAQSSLVARRIRALADEKNIPVLAFCEDVAASGGYWLASAADEIYADPASIIGSIGVVGGGFGFVGLLEKLGVKRRLYTAGKRKGTLDPFKPEKRDDVRHLARLQKDIHQEFRDWVRARRGARLSDDDEELFSGAVWTGRMAQDLGLVDGLGGMHGILRERYGEHVRIKTVNARRPWLKQVLGLASKESHAADAAHGTVAAALAALEERLTWNRYGL